jgi:hypothetical protein
MQMPMDPNGVYFEIVKGNRMIMSSWDCSGKPLLSRLDFLNLLMEFNGVPYGV